jgi:predicted deacylase
MAGGGRVSLDALAICRRGVRNVLAHLSVLDAGHAHPRESDGTILELPGTNAYVYATVEGIFEPFHPNGAEVRAGQPAGRIHCTWDPAREPEVLHYQSDGLVYGRRQPGHVKPGNCCTVVATRYRGEIA